VPDSVVVIRRETPSTVVVSSGRQGPQGVPGAQGIPGPPGPAVDLDVLLDVITIGAQTGDALVYDDAAPPGGKWSPKPVVDLLTFNAFVAQTVNDGDPAGGVLAGTYPDPGFAPSPTFTAAAPTVAILTLRGAVAQSGPYLEARDSLDTVKASIDFAGAGHFAIGSDVAGVPIATTANITAHTTNPVHPYTDVAKTWTALQTFTPSVNTAVGLVVQGLAGQSGHIQQWQDSTGAVKSAVDASGGSFNASDFGSLTSTKARLRTNYDTGGLGVTTAADTNKGLVIRANSGAQSATVFEIQSASGTIFAGSTHGGIGFFGASAPLGNNQFGVVSGAITRVPIIARGAASQTADLFQAQDSSGGVLTWITSAGLIRTISDVIVDGRFGASGKAQNYLGGASIASAILSIQPGGDPAWVPVVVRGAAAQSADLVQLQASGGGVLSKVRSDGSFFATFFQSMASNASYIGWAGGSPTNQMVPQTAASVALQVKGAASQVSDLQQWQNSAAVNLAYLQSDGSMRTDFVGSITASKTSLRFNYDTGGIGVTPAADANKGLVIRRNSVTQTADLFQVQRENGAVRLAIDLSGRLAVGNPPPIGLSNGIVATPISEAVTPLLVKGFAAQTADLFQSQDSAGVNYLAITASGLPRWSAATMVQTTVGAAGTAATLPAKPTKFLKVVDEVGTTLVVPAYAAA
jgi:hypothetical protein